MENTLYDLGRTLLSITAPVLITMITIYVPRVAMRAMDWLDTKTATTSSEADRLMVQSALANAGLKAWAAGGGRGAMLSAGIDYLRTSIPETLNRKGINDERTLQMLLEPHIEKVKIDATKVAILPEETHTNRPRPGSDPAGLY